MKKMCRKNTKKAQKSIKNQPERRKNLGKINFFKKMLVL
jgi:hypothetical protein